MASSALPGADRLHGQVEGVRRRFGSPSAARLRRRSPVAPHGRLRGWRRHRAVTYFR